MFMVSSVLEWNGLVNLISVVGHYSHRVCVRSVALLTVWTFHFSIAMICGRLYLLRRLNGQSGQ